MRWKATSARRAWLDVAERFVGGMTERLVLELLEMVGQRLDQRELAIDDQIDQGIDEIVDAERPQPRARRLQAVAHRLEDVLLVLVEGDDVVLAEEDADLAQPDLVVFVERIVQHDEALALVEIELAARIGVEHVLERQRMQVEGHAEVAQHLRTRPARHVDPGAAGRAEMEAALVDLHAVQHLAIVLGVLDQGEVERLVGHGRAPGQRARRSPGLGMAMNDSVHHSLTVSQTSCIT